jgi:MFS transporter, ACDE family, multidrug resistance protein
LSMSNAALFITPLMLRWMQKHSIRYAVRTGFVTAGCLFSIAGLAAGWPWVTVLALVGGSFFLILLDVSGGLPFLLAVKPSERTEMAAVYASFRDVSGILTPGTAWLVLLFAPVSGVFVASGASLLAAWALSSKLHPRLGRARIRIAPAE